MPVYRTSATAKCLYGDSLPLNTGTKYIEDSLKYLPRLRERISVPLGLRVSNRDI